MAIFSAILFELFNNMVVYYVIINKFLQPMLCLLI